MFDCLIVGGGISGLSLSFFLVKLGVKNIALVEKSERLGGKIKTVREDGFTIETGPNGFLDNKPFAFELARELGLEERLVPASNSAEKRFLLFGGRLEEIPLGFVDFLKTPILSPLGKLRVFAEPFFPPFKEWEDPSVLEFGERRIGREAAERLIDPMVAGVYGGRAEDLSMKSAFPLLWDLEKRYGSLVKALFAKRSSKGPFAKFKLFSFRSGLEELVNALEDFLRRRILILTSCRIFSVKLSPGFFRVETTAGEISAKSLVLSIPAFEAANLLGGTEAEGPLKAVVYVPMAVVALGYDETSVGWREKGFGFLVARKESSKILGCLWDSWIFPGRSEKGLLLFRTMIGGGRNPELARLARENLVEIAHVELSRLMNIKSKPVFCKVFRHERAIPQYTLGHRSRLEVLDSFLLKFPGLFLHGNAYRGVGLNDCIGNSMALAKLVLESLK